MPVSTRAANAKAHPGRVDLSLDFDSDSDTAPTPAPVKKKNTRKKAPAIQNDIDEIAQLEDEQMQEDLNAEKDRVKKPALKSKGKGTHLSSSLCFTVFTHPRTLMFYLESKSQLESQGQAQTRGRGGELISLGTGPNAHHTSQEESTQR